MATQESNEKRRNVLKKGAALAGLAICGASAPVLMSGCESDTTKSEDSGVDFDISEVPELSETGGAVKKTFGENNGGRPVVVVRTGDTRFVAMTSVCTHQGCEINLPATAGGNLACPCHGSEFDSVTGAVAQGPAAASLQTFATSFDATKNIVKIAF